MLNSVFPPQLYQWGRKFFLNCYVSTITSPREISNTSLSCSMLLIVHIFPTFVVNDYLAKYSIEIKTFAINLSRIEASILKALANICRLFACFRTVSNIKMSIPVTLDLSSLSTWGFTIKS